MAAITSTRVSPPVAAAVLQEVGARTSKVENERKVLHEKLKADEESLDIIQSSLDTIEERIKQLGELAGLLANC